MLSFRCLCFEDEFFFFSIIKIYAMLLFAVKLLQSLMEAEMIKIHPTTLSVANCNGTIAGIAEWATFWFCSFSQQVPIMRYNLQRCQRGRHEFFQKN
jgi:hypothetical protein